MSTTLILLRNLLRARVESGNFDRVLERVYITKAGDGKLTAEMVIDKEHANRNQTLHGGLMATIVDSMSTLALASLDVNPSQTVDLSNYKETVSASIQLNVSFLRPLPLGQTLTIECSTLRKGKTLAFLNVDLFNKNDGKLIARGSHTKAILCAKI